MASPGLIGSTFDDELARAELLERRLTNGGTLRRFSARLRIAADARRTAPAATPDLEPAPAGETGPAPAPGPAAPPAPTPAMQPAPAGEAVVAAAVQPVAAVQPTPAVTPSPAPAAPAPRLTGAPSGRRRPLVAHTRVGTTSRPASRGSAPLTAGGLQRVRRRAGARLYPSTATIDAGEEAEWQTFASGLDDTDRMAQLDADLGRESTRLNRLANRLMP